MEALDADAIQATMSSPPIGGGVAADRIADAFGTPGVIGEKANVTAFVVRRFVDRSLLVDLSANPEGTLHHLDQVAEVCRREDLANLVAADTSLEPEQAAARLRVRRADFEHMDVLMFPVVFKEPASTVISRCAATAELNHPHRHAGRRPRPEPRHRGSALAPPQGRTFARSSATASTSTPPCNSLRPLWHATRTWCRRSRLSGSGKIFVMPECATVRR
ncbi:hypothetical protein [Streptomyces sp. NPDC007172]|uniref:hypothetical protein n=1 Tax=Streptomyces sp. NPDC007172 TaxID=3364776 RepID=UPI00368C0DCF